jgi:hypothetical protein
MQPVSLCRGMHPPSGLSRCGGAISMAVASLVCMVLCSPAALATLSSAVSGGDDQALDANWTLANLSNVYASAYQE